MTEQDYLQRIHELEKQVSRLQTELKKNSETQYGLRWMDVPEAFEEDAENAIPTLEEVKEKAITNDDGKPTHILIEGDNFHALTCLNYTHKGNIDVIYIDPPYNTGSDGFVYKDKRVLDKFPDGTTVPTDHPLRHSYWLSFMHKRLELAKNLLSERGVIFISIDDNEQANLKLLCDQVFGERNFIGTFKWNRVAKAPSLSYSIRTKYEYILAYKNNITPKLFGKESYNTMAPLWHLPNKQNLLVFPANSVKINQSYSKGLYSEKYQVELLDDIVEIGGFNGNEFRIKACSAWGQEKISSYVQEGNYFVVKKSLSTVYTCMNPENSYIAPSDLISDDECGVKTNTDASDRLKEMGFDFNYSKPISLIQFLTRMVTHEHPTSIILDFFAGSGTTMHATMQLNEEDGGHRQCILVQQNENNICENVTYERNRRVMQGYTNAKGEHVPGLGNSLKYYRTAFVGEHDIQHINDADKVALTQKAGCLLALGENTLEEIKTEKAYQIFQLRKGDKPANDFGYTAVYFSGDLIHFADFRREIERIQQEHPLSRIAVYVFTWGDSSVFANEFDDLSGITIKPIPQPILEIYLNINK